MAIRIAINGYGRIGRNVLCAYFEQQREDIEIVAINSLCTLEHAAYSTKFDTIHGRFKGTIECLSDKSKQYLIINGRMIRFTSIKTPENLPWNDLKVDIVLECSGVFRTKQKCMGHINAGAKKVIISAPADNNECDATVVVGVNESIITNEMTVISNASCTTNALAPIVKVLHNIIGIESGLMTTVHSYTNDQVLIDGDHNDFYRSRAAALNMIPTKTGAAQAVGIVIPELAGKLSGYSIRVPTPNVSIVDFTFNSARPTTKDEVNQIVKSSTLDSMKGIVAYNNEPLVSSDFNHTQVSANFDSNHTFVQNSLVKIAAWYDNEWAFSCRMLDLSTFVMN